MKNNVVSIFGKSKFQSNRKAALDASTKKSSGTLSTHLVAKRQFSFIEGDKLICRYEFDPDEVTPATFVIVDYDGVKRLAVNADIQNVVAVVIAFTRELVTGN